MSVNNPDARHLIITGVVQGVGFRYHMMETACRLGIGGWVLNRGDGTVEAVIVGNTRALAAMIDWVSRGPTGAQVDLVMLEQIEQTPIFNEFSLRPTE
jgi:acylphosphatase